MMGRARASGEAQAISSIFVKFTVFHQTKKTRTANTRKTAVVGRRDLYSKTQW